MPNVDYGYCFRNGIRVLGIGPVFAEPVAEAALGMAIDLARGITRSDRNFRQGIEEYGLAANREAFSLFRQNVGFVGLGDLGRAILPLLQPFHCHIRAYDPWLPEEYLRHARLRRCFPRRSIPALSSRFCRRWSNLGKPGISWSSTLLPDAIGCGAGAGQPRRGSRLRFLGRLCPAWSNPSRHRCVPTGATAGSPPSPTVRQHIALRTSSWRPGRHHQANWKDGRRRCEADLERPASSSV